MSAHQDIRPNLFIVGQPKSGTTALHQFLSEHPDIFMSPYKEPSYFCTDFHLESDAFHGSRVYFPIRNEDQYIELFAGATNEKIVGESSVNYLYSANAAEEIQRFSPDAKIIIILRDPVSFLHSLYQMNVRRTWEPSASFEEALALEALRKRGEQVPPNVNFPSNLFYARRAEYFVQVQRFFERFDPGRIKILIYEDFKNDNARWYAEVLEFLGVDSTFQPEFRIVNPSGAVRNSYLNSLLRTRWIIKLGYSMIPKKRHVWLQRNILNRLTKSERTGLEQLEGRHTEHLRARFAPEVDKISEFLGRDLVTKWNYSPH